MTTCNRCGAPAHPARWAILCRPCEDEAPLELVGACKAAAARQSMRFRLGEGRLDSIEAADLFLRPWRELRQWAHDTRGSPDVTKGAP